VYRVRIVNAATRELARLDKPFARRIIERITWLATNRDTISPEALTGELAGFYKLREAIAASSMRFFTRNRRS
jgi:mRNA interferase RelE/StbE